MGPKCYLKRVKLKKKKKKKNTFSAHNKSTVHLLQRKGELVNDLMEKNLHSLAACLSSRRLSQPFMDSTKRCNVGREKL